MKFAFLAIAAFLLGGTELFAEGIDCQTQLENPYSSERATDIALGIGSFVIATPVAIEVAEKMWVWNGGDSNPNAAGVSALVLGFASGAAIFMNGLRLVSPRSDVAQLSNQWKRECRKPKTAKQTQSKVKTKVLPQAGGGFAFGIGLPF